MLIRGGGWERATRRRRPARKTLCVVQLGSRRYVPRGTCWNTSQICLLTNVGLAPSHSLVRLARQDRSAGPAPPRTETLVVETTPSRRRGPGPHVKSPATTTAREETRERVARAGATGGGYLGRRRRPHWTPGKPVSRVKGVCEAGSTLRSTTTIRGTGRSGTPTGSELQGDEEDLELSEFLSLVPRATTRTTSNP